MSLPRARVRRDDSSLFMFIAFSLTFFSPLLPQVPVPRVHLLPSRHPRRLLSRPLRTRGVLSRTRAPAEGSGVVSRGRVLEVHVSWTAGERGGVSRSVHERDLPSAPGAGEEGSRGGGGWREGVPEAAALLRVRFRERTLHDRPLLSGGRGEEGGEVHPVGAELVPGELGGEAGAGQLEDQPEEE